MLASRKLESYEIFASLGVFVFFAAGLNFYFVIFSYPINHKTKHVLNVKNAKSPDLQRKKSHC